HEGKHLGAGISHFVEHLLFKGTEKREGKRISEEIQEAGGYINAYTTFDRTVYYIDAPSENVDAALDVLSDAVFCSNFPAEEVDKERDVILHEIDMGEDDPEVKLSHALFDTAFRKHPYRYPIIGYRELFEKLSREDLLEYYGKRYAPNNCVLVVSGNFESDSIRESIEKYYGSFERKALEEIYLPNEPKQLALRRRELREDVQVSRVGLGFQSPGLTNEDTPALDALSMVLGNGSSSMLNQKLREELELVHSVDASNWTPGSMGVFYIAMVADPDKMDTAIEALRKYVSELRDDDFSQAAVNKAVRQLLMGEINSRKTVSGQASRLGSAEVVVGDIGYASSYLERVSKITAADLHRVLKKWLRDDRLTVLTMEPKEAAEKRESVSEGDLTEQDFAEFKQENGSSLLMRRNDRLPNVHIRMVFEAGSLFEEEGQQGLTSMLSTMLTKDTEKRDRSEVAFAIESVGGSFYDFSGNNSLGLAIEVMPSDLDLALDVLEEATLRPSFSEGTFQLEKSAHLSGIKEQLDDVVSAGRRLLREKFFGDHPFRLGGSGSLETVEPLDVEAVASFWKKIFVSENVSLAVSGNYEEALLRPKLEAFLAKIPTGSLLARQYVFEKPLQVGAHREKMERQQAVVFHAYPGHGLRDDDFYVSEVADELFSGMSSRLFERVRDELGLAYFVRSSRIIGLDTAMFYFYAGTSEDGYEAVIDELEKEVARVARGEVSDEELKRCKTRLKAARRMSMQTNGACAGQAAMNVAYGLTANDWRNYDGRIEGVTAADLQRFAQENLSEGNRVELVVGAIGE
ncbi:MAG: pitrilysin family protein, partial [Verrucomicrobiota bacterium]